MFHILKNYTVNSNSDPYYIEYLLPGKYLFECWGAQGGHSNGGKGGFTSGKINLFQETTFYIVVGGQGSKIAGGYNGGGYGGKCYDNSDGYGGGGGTDIRLNPNNTDSRIIVAGGGGGACGYSDVNFGGHAGGSEGGESRRLTSDHNCTGYLSQ